MTWLNLINGIGVLIAAGYSGFVTVGDRIPWSGYGATLVFLIGFILPLLLESHHLNQRFGEIETSYRLNRRREVNPPRQEVLSGPATPDVPVKPPRNHRAILICAVIAGILLLYDVIDLNLNGPAATPTQGALTNF